VRVWAIAALGATCIVLAGLAIRQYSADQASRTVSVFSEVPRYPGAIAIHKLRTDRLIEDSFVTPADLQQIVDYYDRTLRADGWAPVAHIERGDTATICYRKEGYSAGVTTRSSSQSGSYRFAFGVSDMSVRPLMWPAQFAAVLRCSP